MKNSDENTKIKIQTPYLQSLDQNLKKLHIKCSEVGIKNINSELNEIQPKNYFEEIKQTWGV